jgi:iron(III) transport system substrate-binding protein
MKKRLVVAMIIALAVSMTVFAGGKSDGAGKPAENKVVVYSPLPLEFLDTITSEFKKNTGIEVEVIALGTGECLKRIEAEVNTPIADVQLSGTVSTIGARRNLFADYSTVNEPFMQDTMKNKEGMLTRFVEIPSVIMVNTRLIGNIKVEGYQDLLNPALKGKIAACNPASSSSAWEHLVNMLYAMGNGDPEKGWPYVEQLVKQLNGKMLNSSSAVYKGVADGEYTVGLTFEEGGANYVSAGAPVKLVYMSEGVVFKDDGVYLVKNAPHLENGKKFIDFVTGKEAQTIINNKLNRRTARKDLPESPILMSKDKIKVIKDNDDYVAAHKQAWLDKFKDLYTSSI